MSASVRLDSHNPDSGREDRAPNSGDRLDGLRDVEGTDDAMAAGFDRHIVKPIDPERVAHTVQELLRQPRAEKADYCS